MAAILVVDDDGDFCEALSRYLSALGHLVHCEGDGRAGLKSLMRTDPDVILADLKMPIMDGVAFVRVVRSYVRFRTLPVVIMTGISDEAILNEMESYGVNAILKKGSFEFADVRRLIETATGEDEKEIAPN